MKNNLILGAALTLAAFAPGIACADFVLDTGTPTGASVVLNTAGWYAAEFSVTAGETIASLSAYLTEGVGTVGNTYTWDIYSASGTFLGANREPFTFTATGTFEANGWNTTTVNWTPTTSGAYWVALQVSSTSQTRGLDLPTESSATTGTVPATEFAYSKGGAYSTTSAPSVGLEIATVPLPPALWLLGGGLLGLGARIRRRP